MEAILSQAFTYLIHGHRLYVEVHGQLDKSPLILLHHGLGSTRAWRRQIPALVQAGYCVIAYDRWGYGKSDPRAALSAPTFNDDQQDLLALMDTLGVKRVALIGHSDGGTIALYFAAAHPQRVACLVTLAAHVYVETKMEPGILGVRYTYENDPEFRKGLNRVHGEKFERVFFNWFNAWAKPEHRAWDMRPLLSNITCPVLVIQGEDDEHATPQHAYDIAAAIPGAQCWIIPGTGHMAQRDAAKDFNRRVLAFLKENYV